MKNTLTIVLLLTTALTYSQETDSIIDIRDGQQYKIVKIGEQWWMAENLNTFSDYSWYYNNDSITYASTYGRLYNWAASMNIDQSYNTSSYATVYPHQGLCPVGWYLPSDGDWTELTDYLGGESIAGGKLKEEGNVHWNTNTGATNESGFTALPGGDRGTNGVFGDEGGNGYWWSANEDLTHNSLYAWSRHMYANNSIVLRYGSSKEVGFSVRCVRDILSNNLTISDKIFSSISELYFNGEKIDEEVIISNSSAGQSITISSIYNNNSEFTLNKSSSILAPGDTIHLTVNFEPSAKGIYYDTLYIKSDDPNDTLKTIPLYGTYTTEACGVITQNTTWTKANSPYFISCNLAVDAGVTLTIEPGVTVIVDSLNKIIVDGELIVNGAEGDTIVFTNDGDDKFDQIYFRSTGSGEFSYFKIENAQTGVYTENDTLNFSNGIIQSSTIGVNLSGSGSTFNNITFTKNSISINSNNSFIDVYFSSFVDNDICIKTGTSKQNIIGTSFVNNNYGVDLNQGDIEISNCTFSTNTYYAIKLYFGSWGGGAKISDNIINKNGSGIESDNPPTIISNNQIINNYGNGISGSYLNIIACNISGNSGNGIEAWKSTVENNTISNNLLNGIYSTGDNTIEYNSVYGNTLDGIIGNGNSPVNYNDIFNNGDDGIETSALPTINNNNIYNNTGYNLHATKQTSEIINAENNYWGYTESSDISASIYDYYDDGVTVKVDFDPYYSDTIDFVTAPSDLVSTTLGISQIQLSWTDNSDNETGFEIQRSDSLNIYYTIIDTTAANETSYLDSNLVANTHYYYRIRGINDTNNSEFSNETDTSTLTLFSEIAVSLLGGFNGDAAWGDYDNDGDLDVMLSGSTDGTSDGIYTALYKNEGSGTFTPQDINLFKQLYYGSIEWGDYDNDGDLDILLTGDDYYIYFSIIYQNNGDNTFTEQSAISLPGVRNGSVKWGDYDNDGDQDILLTGRTIEGPCISKVYQNDGDNTFLEQTEILLPEVFYSSVVWSDYDNDNDLDILLTGTLEGLFISEIYQNIGNNSFIKQTGISLTGIYNGSVAWGDYDNDGDLDILLTGNPGAGWESKIYQNNGNNSFSDISAVLAGVEESSAEWGDFDNDGDLDILLTGLFDWTQTPISKIYKNNGSNTFVEQNGIEITGVGKSSAKWSDYDNDGDLDILLTGENEDWNPISKIYRNNSGTKNTLPNPPANLSATTYADSVILSWNAATDAETPSPGLTYNVFVRTPTDTIVMPHCNPENGYIKVPEMGNAQLGTDFLLKDLEDGVYFWKVQAVDNSFAGSAFSDEEYFIIGSGRPYASDEYSCYGEATPDLIAIGQDIKWYDNAELTNLVHTGETFSTSETEIGIYTYYVTQTIVEESDPDTVTLYISSMPASPVLSIELGCEGSSIPDLVATGTKIAWYDDDGLTNNVYNGDIFSSGQTSPGIYTYYATQTINSCTSPAGSTTLTINFSPEIISAVSTDKSSCAINNGTITISATGDAPLIYSIDGGINYFDNGGNFTGLDNGNYPVAVMNVYNCETFGDTHIVTSIGIPPPPAAGTNADYCFGDDLIDLNTSASMGGNLTWYSDAGLNIIIGTGTTHSPSNIIGTTTYYATETLDDCESLSSKVNVTINSIPSVSISNSTNISCNGLLDGTATVSVSGGTAPYTYKWNDNASSTNSTVTGLSANVNYNIIVTDANSCTATNSVILSEPLPLSISSDYSHSVCLNSNTGYIDISVSGGTLPYNYNWSNSETTEDVENLFEGDYSVNISDSKACSIYDNFTIDEIEPFGDEEICLVTVGTSGKNMIIWEKTPGKGTEFYNIYRESNTIGVYDLMGTVPYNDLSIFIDESSEPRNRSYQYKISVIDSCGNESAKSYYHRTMLLKLGIGVNAYNLDWDNYEYEAGGFTFGQYNIYRGNAEDNLQKIYTIGGNYYSYIDNNPPTGMIYYQIGGEKESGCFPTFNKKGLLEENYTESLSNIKDNEYTGIDDVDNSSLLKIYPNPFNNITTIEFPNQNYEKYSLRVTNIAGQLVRTIDGITENSIMLNREGLAAGLYFIELSGSRIYRGKIVIE